MRPISWGSQVGPAGRSIAWRLAGRDDRVVVAALAVASALAWLYLAFAVPNIGSMRETTDGRMGMAPRNGMSMGPMPEHWTPAYAALIFVMWSAMMVAMMLPSAIPLTLVYAAVARKADRQGTPVGSTGSLVAGYMGAWFVFSLAATSAEWGLERLSILPSAMSRIDAPAGAAIVIAAGIYELTPLKQRCLDQCRDPARIISAHWRTGPSAAMRMGAELGLFCLGCCWVLMALLFVGGVMNLLWVAIIATFVLLEKIAPLAHVWHRIAGAGMVIAGAITAVAVG